MSTTQTPTVPVDAAIVGGGIAGAWVLKLLTDKGFNVVLLERDASAAIRHWRLRG